MTCQICEHPDMDFFNLMKHYCSDMNRMIEETCDKHQGVIQRMGFEFVKTKTPDYITDDTKTTDGYFNCVNDDGYGLFLSHNSDESDKMLDEIKKWKKDAKRFREFFDALTVFIPLEDIPWNGGEIDMTKFVETINEWRESFHEHQ